MKAILLTLRQVKYENRVFWRNPVAAFFTFVFPLMFLVIFNLLFGTRDLESPHGVISISTFYVPAILVLSVVTACYTNIAMGITFARDEGSLKRVRGTPLPASALLMGKVIHSVLVALLLVAIVTAAGVLFYNVDPPTNTSPAFLVSLVLAAATFCALGLAVTSIIPNADAAPAVVQASILPLMFISDVFIPLRDAPAWLTTFADIFPIRHFSTTMHTAFSPFESGLGFEPLHLGVMALWMVAGMAVAVRYFRWEPRR